MNLVVRPNHRILLIEDNAGDGLLFREALHNSKYNTTLDHVVNGHDALDFLHQRGLFTSALVPDLILMDLTLNQLNGFELLGLIKKEPGIKSIPLIVFTGSDMPDDITKAYMAGSNGYIKKPIGIEGLERVVRVLEEYWFGTSRIPSKLDRS